MRDSLTRLTIITAACLLLAACGQPSAPAAPAKQEAKPVAQPAPTQAPAPKPTEPPIAQPAPAAAPAAGAAKFDPKAVEQFYAGKTIRIIVGSAPGGGYDAYARAVARHLGRMLPGNPTVIVENMEGAASLRAANSVYRAQPKDGTVIGHIQGGLFIQQLLGLSGVEFDAMKWRVLGVPAVEKSMCLATARSGIKSLADVMNPGGKQFIVGANAPGAATWDGSMRLKAALDLNLKMVDGYDGTAKIRLAMDQGELDGACGWGLESLRATAWDRIQAGDYVVIAQATEQPQRDLESVPMALDLAKTDEARDLIRLGVILPGKIIRPFVAAPDVPEDRAQALRQAFDAIWKDAASCKYPHLQHRPGRHG